SHVWRHARLRRAPVSSYDGFGARGTLADRPALPSGRRHEGSADETPGTFAPMHSCLWRTRASNDILARVVRSRKRMFADVADAKSWQLASTGAATANAPAFPQLNPSPFALLSGPRRLAWAR